MITQADVDVMVKYLGLLPSIAALVLYTRELMVGDEIWCGCGDEINWPRESDDMPVYIRPDGQYCCWICATTTYEHLNLPEAEVAS